MERGEQFSGEKFLARKFPDLKKSKALKREEERRRREGNPSAKDPTERIFSWLKRLEGTKGHRDNPEKLQNLKDYYYSKYVIKSENIPNSYFINKKRLAREQGCGDIEITNEMKEMEAEIIRSEQRSSLEKWINYFASAEGDVYPMWAKYWVFRSMLKLSSYDKKKKSFGTRRKDTVASFPELNREAMYFVVNNIVKRVNQEDITAQEDNPELTKLIKKENFGKLYAYAVENATSTTGDRLLKIKKGEWVRYPKGSDFKPLAESLQGRFTGWCIVAEPIADAYLRHWDMHIFYSYDEFGKRSIPRVLIRMDGDKIEEVRGTAFGQKIDFLIRNVVKQKLSEFSDGKKYEKKVGDMILLTQIEKKQKENKELTMNELGFLYEIDSVIEGFGDKKDPRIEEIKKKRNQEYDYGLLNLIYK